jgi:dipeptidase E
LVDWLGSAHHYKIERVFVEQDGMRLPHRVLLISNSTVHGRGYLDHVKSEIESFLGSARRVLFFPFALHDRDAYTATARTRFAAMGYSIDSAHETAVPQKAVEETDAIFIGGGNTFRLLKALQDLDLIEAIRRKVGSGAPYIGSSAGSNVAGPTIKTTKDMPIVQPRSFNSLGLVPFQISPHYLDPDPNSTHMGETQEERILHFLEENDTPVVGMREGAWLLCTNGAVTLKGEAGARIFRRGESPIEATPGTEISRLVGAPDAS